MPDLAGLIVNYNSAPLARKCVESLRRECQAAGLDCEIIIVDNDSPMKERDYPILRELEQEGCQVLFHDANPGYAGGMNLALELASSKVIAVLNPDLEFDRGSVKTLHDYVLEHPECGAAGPLGYYDANFTITLPRNEMPTLRDHVKQAFAHLFPSICRRYSKKRSRIALHYWTHKQPMAIDMLSGACVFMRREVIDRIGGLFDERYPLYYEDADLFRRINDSSLQCVYVPEARIVHFYSQSAHTVHDEAMRRYHRSQVAYFKKWNGTLARFLGHTLPAKVLDRWPDRYKCRPPHAVEELGAIDRSYEFVVDTEDEFFLEICLDAMFFLAGAILHPGNPYRFPQETWKYFGQQFHFVRAVSKRSLEVLKVWSFIPAETVPASSMPAPV